MNSQELRKIFLEYFKSLGHTIVPSDSLIPTSDPTLLFTSAGMVQFKEYFLGIKKGLSRAASVQKCFRTSDIDKVGYTARHLTFFEMLGNFSFGDYFKKEAIEWAWEFLIRKIGLDEKMLFITVYKEDDEAYDIWSKIVDNKKIYKLSEDTNFWRMGDTGPCGPCSEIIYDLGEEYGCGKPDCSVGCDCDRYLEIWNLVFTQFDAQPNKVLKPLLQKNIDTGMGLERLNAVVNGKKTVFDTDTFVLIKEELLKNIDIAKEYKTLQINNYVNAILDHSRALTFIAAEGILPSNEGRGYVLRKIIRRGLRYAKLLGFREPILYKMVPVVVKAMKDQYPELELHREKIAVITKTEEEKFLETLDSGMKILQEIINQGKKKISGEVVFHLYDTYGFPEELVKEILQEYNIEYDRTEFLTAQENARKISKSSWRGIDTINTSVYTSFPETKFVGYEVTSTKSKILGIIQQSKIIPKGIKGQQLEIIVDVTPFYGESGGQVGDTGVIKNENYKIIGEVVDTKKIEQRIVHIVNLKDDIATQKEIFLEINIERRKNIMRHHTSTHLLHKALREVLGEHAVQSGSLVADEYFRFDFIHYRPVSEEELRKIELIVNQKILENLPVKIEYTDFLTAKQLGATALFEEKYGQTVRMVIIGDIKDKPYSIELCGGTHCRSTGEIGCFKIISESSIGANLRRIEAVSGLKVYEYLNMLEKQRNNIAAILNTSVKEIEDKITKLIKHNKDLQQQINNLQLSLGTQNVHEFIEEFKNCKFVIKKLEDVNVGLLRSLSDKLFEKYQSICSVIIIFSYAQQKLFFIIRTTRKAVDKGFTAQVIAKILNNYLKTNSGGREDFVEGGGKVQQKPEPQEIFSLIKQNL